MAIEYRPSAPYSTPMILLKPLTTTVGGVRKKTFQPLESGSLIYCSFKTYGGTERDVNGIYSIEDTATIETWFRPDITKGCAVAFTTGEVYEILGKPENINMRNQYLTFKARRIEGGV